MKNFQVPAENKPQQLKDFKEDIQAAILRGESLEQLAERIGEDTVPNFYGANFRAAYNEGIEAGSAYGYEQPLDLHDAMRHAVLNMGAGITADFNSKKPITVEAEFEVIESKTGATFICEVQQVGGKRCVVQCETCRNNEGQLIGSNNPYFIPADKHNWSEEIHRMPPEQFKKLITGNWDFEPEIRKPKKGTYLVCPDCENPFPHSHVDGSFSCEDCGKKWKNFDYNL